MTNINIDEIRITSNQCWVRINGIDSCLGLYETSVLLSKITEKFVTIKSREYHKHNDYRNFRNSFMLKLNGVLNNANHNRNIGIKDKIEVPFWLIDEIAKTDNNKNGSSQIKVTLRNIMNEQLEDN